MGKPLSQSGRGGQDRNLDSCQKVKAGRAARILVTIREPG